MSEETIQPRPRPKIGAWREVERDRPRFGQAPQSGASPAAPASAVAKRGLPPSRVVAIVASVLLVMIVAFMSLNSHGARASRAATNAAQNQAETIAHTASEAAKLTGTSPVVNRHLLLAAEAAGALVGPGVRAAPELSEGWAEARVSIDGETGIACVRLSAGALTTAEGPCASAESD